MVSKTYQEAVEIINAVGEVQIMFDPTHGEGGFAFARVTKEEALKVLATENFLEPDALFSICISTRKNDKGEKVALWGN